MAVGAIQFYDSFMQALGQKKHDLDADTIKVILVSSSYTFSASHAQYSDITNELSTANGYTAGGATLANAVFTQTSGVGKFDADDVVWTASGGAITARRAILYNDTSTNDLLIGSFLLDATPANVSVPNGDTLGLNWNASGIFTLQAV